MKKAIAIIVLGLLLSTNAYAEVIYLKNCNNEEASKSLLKRDFIIDSEKMIITDTFVSVKNETYRNERNIIFWEDSIVLTEKYKTPKNPATWQLELNLNNSSVKLLGWEENGENLGKYKPLICDKLSKDLTFTIDDKKEQCEAIGFTPQTEKFADCVLRLVELDVKTQQNNQIALAESQGNQQIADELRKQRNQQGGQYLMDLGQKLLAPPVSKRTTRTCTVYGAGGVTTVSCR